MATTKLNSTQVPTRPYDLIIPCSDQTSDLETGEDVISFFTPRGITVAAVFIYVNTAPTGAAIIVDIKENGTSIFSTKPQIDAGENSSLTGVLGTISDAVLGAASVISIDIDQVGSSTPGKGLMVAIRGSV